MEAEVITSAASQGLFALLFVVLFSYQIRSTEKREDRMLENKKEIQRNAMLMQEESREREETLMKHHQQTIISLDDLAKSNKEIVQAMSNLEKQTTEGFDKIWERIESKQGR